MSINGPLTKIRAVNFTTGVVDLGEQGCIQCSEILDSSAHPMHEMLMNLIHQHGYGYTPNLGLFSFEEIENGALWEYGEVLFGDASEPVSSNSQDDAVSEAKPVISYYELMKALGQEIKKYPSRVYQNMPSLNLMGPAWGALAKVDQEPNKYVKD